MKLFNIIFCVLFGIAAALQYNDPDPYLWIPIYLTGAFLCFRASKGIIYPSAYIAVVVVYIIYGIYLIFDKHGVIYWATERDLENIADNMQASKPWIEETREFFGLMILVFVLGFNYIRFRDRNTF